MEKDDSSSPLKSSLRRPVSDARSLVWSWEQQDESGRGKQPHLPLSSLPPLKCPGARHFNPSCFSETAQWPAARTVWVCVCDLVLGSVGSGTVGLYWLILKISELWLTIIFIIDWSIDLLSQFTYCSVFKVTQNSEKCSLEFPRAIL